MPDARQTVGFVFAVAVVASIFVATSAVALRERQEENAILDLRRKVLGVAGLAERGEELSRDEINRRFQGIRQVVVDLASGEPVDTNPESFDQRARAQDPETSRTAPDNSAKVARLPDRAMVFQVIEADTIHGLIIPIEGQGLWSTMYGYLALSPDLAEVTGITFYEHGETAGLGGEIDNPRWQALWQGRKAFDQEWQPAIQVIKGAAGPPRQDPYSVDGLSGATITGRGVTNTIEFWLGPEAFGPYLERYRRERGIS